MITGEILEHQGFEYSGPIALCCGASSEQKQTYQEQNQYYQTLMNQAKSEYGFASQVFNDLFQSLNPIVEAGPNQEGYSPAELQNLESQNTTGTGEAYNSALKAINESRATQGGGNLALPSGVALKQRQQLATSSAEQEAKNRNIILTNDYDTGRQNYDTAVNQLEGATGVFNPATSSSGAANQGGSAAGETANEIAQASNSWVNAVSGALGGVAGAATGAELGKK